MKFKSILTAVLIVFVVASVVVLAIKEITKSARGDKPASVSGPRVIAYYFHGKVRCPTCNSIESYAKEAVQCGFPEQLGSGRLEWRVVNYEESGNEHFATDYNFVSPSLVLVTMQGEKQLQWRNLRSLGVCERQTQVHRVRPTECERMSRHFNQRSRWKMRISLSRIVVPVVTLAAISLASCVYAAEPATQSKSAEPATQAKSAEQSKQSKPAAPAAPAAKQAHRVVVCYFHRTVRCPTCKRISAYIEESLKGGMAAEMKQGTVEWVMIDFQDKKNEKYTPLTRSPGRPWSSWT